MILMDTWVYAAIPKSASSNLIRTPISFHYEEIAPLQAVTLQFASEDLDLVYLAQIQPVTHNVRDSKEWKHIIAGDTLGILRYTS